LVRHRLERVDDGEDASGERDPRTDDLSRVTLAVPPLVIAGDDFAHEWLEEAETPHQLLAEGKSTGQIADELVLSQVTVRNHIAHVLANLGVRTRVQAVIAAARAGLIRLPTADEPADHG
jgi:regulatory LuxR family protein